MTNNFAENKQIEVLNSSNQTIGKYWYDGDGKRVKKYVPSTSETTIFIYDASGKLVEEYSTVVESSTNAKVGYLTNDHLGSPRINTDRNGAITARHDYQPFGEEVSTSQRVSGLGYADDTVRKQFTGYERDGETELDFAQARMYQSKLGRFSSPDEIFADQWEDDPQSWNLYLYVGNNPLKYTDPLGRWKWVEPDNNGYRFLEWEEGDTWETLAIFLNSNSEDGYSSSDLEEVYGGGGLGEGVIIDLQGSGGPRFTNIRPIEDASLDLLPVGKATKGSSFWQRVRSFFGFGGTKVSIKAAKKIAPAVAPKLCFVAGTLVLAEDGLKPIEEIKEGDKVLSYNEKTRQTEYKTVVQTMVREAEAGRILSLKVEGEAEALGVTGEHPFYVRVHGARGNLSSEDDHGKWIEAKDLHIGDEIRRADGTWAKVEFVSQRSKGAKVYNFEVAGNHNYFVGQSNLLVHNNNDCVKVLQTGGNKLKNSTVKALQKAFEEQTGRTVSKEQIKQALEALKKFEGKGNDFHGQIMSNGDIQTKTGEFIGNIFQFIP